MNARGHIKKYIPCPGGWKTPGVKCLVPARAQGLIKNLAVLHMLAVVGLHRSGWSQPHTN